MVESESPAGLGRTDQMMSFFGIAAMFVAIKTFFDDISADPAMGEDEGMRAYDVCKEVF